MPNADLWSWVWSTGIHVSVSSAYFAMVFAWASGKISPCKVICVYDTLRRNMPCKDVADHHILRGSSVHLQLDMSWFFSRDWGKDQQTWSFLSILDDIPSAVLVLRVVTLSAMKSSSWDGGRQRGRVRAKRAGFVTILLVAEGWKVFLALVETQWGAQTGLVSSGSLHGS